jgi:hypothetical protein
MSAFGVQAKRLDQQFRVNCGLYACAIACEKDHFDQCARMGAGLDVELRAIGFDQGFRQGKADAGSQRPVPTSKRPEGMPVLRRRSGSSTIESLGGAGRISCTRYHR